MSVNNLTINRIGKDGFQLLPATEGILVNVQGVGTNPDGDRFVNTPNTWLVLHHVIGHAYTVYFTVTAPKAEVRTQDYGDLDLDDIVISLASSATDPKMRLLQIPVGYNVNGEVLIKATSQSEWASGKVKIAAVELS